MHIFPKAIAAGFAVLFLMGVGQCPSTPSTTEEVVVIGEGEVAEDPNQLVDHCNACVKDVPGCMNGLINNGEQFCGALHKCETDLKCDMCVTVNNKTYVVWREFAQKRARKVCD